ncbi:hypothetical protein [Scandinavium goeteborgense]|uniref:Uncharacterized protein n=1 Tax=Scandinavium goeteborgense TaxID=1851514 RepID=A0A4R6EWW7_SCAGO|nr:hypothetical protein [Scandinavium goeteborgense]TDN64273.1 hypothetical protein EC847_101198 [Scandinavium goeteborgense]
MNMTIEQITAAYPNVAKLESKAGHELLAEIYALLDHVLKENIELRRTKNRKIQITLTKPSKSEQQIFKGEMYKALLVGINVTKRNIEKQLSTHGIFLEFV